MAWALLNAWLYRNRVSTSVSADDAVSCVPCAGLTARKLRHVEPGNTLDVSARHLRAEWHGAIDLDADLRPPAAADILAETGRNLDGELDVAAPQAPFHLGGVGDRRAFAEISRSREVLQILAAFPCLVAVEGRIGQVLDIERDAVAEGDHEDQRSDQSESEPDRVAQDLQRLAAGIGAQAPETERRIATRLLRGVCLTGDDVRRIVRRGAERFIGLPQIDDEGVFERLNAPAGNKVSRHTARQHLAGMHQRDAVTALGLVHEVGGDEDRHPLIARQFDQEPPEAVAGNRVDARGGLIEDQHLRLMDNGGGQAAGADECRGGGRTDSCLRPRQGRNGPSAPRPVRSSRSGAN